MQEMQGRSLGLEDPLEKGMATRSWTVAWEMPWTRSLAGCSPWGRTESDTTERHARYFSVRCARVRVLVGGTVLGVPGACAGWLAWSVGWSNGLRDDSSFCGVNGPA